ncbi:SDR family NAD(P)-dependent oxidoreductase [Kineococcus sp. SYSU DK003]|uniref:SDR family NAD(P)-dependent oxidoreductase n=1 Tax=Kineococcus sp. SYSU DK003 TaxID=3383124 RepID=UPI003D7CA784
MSGKHVLVTGAASGIGRRIALDFADAGWTVSGTDLRAEDVEQELDGSAAALAADLADPAQATAVVEQAAARQPLDALVNAAGIYPAVPFAELTAESWDQVMAVNLRAPFLTTQAFAAQGRPGCVVNISSGAALRSRPGAAHYATSKAALEVLTRSAALELGPAGIRVNAVAPGFVTVDSAANPVTEEYAAAVSANPLGRRGEPADISRAVRWLISDEAEWITGTVLRVDGGGSAGTNALPLHWNGTTSTQEAP